MDLNRLMYKDRTLILAYDQGLEHGPSDFNDKNVDPSYVLDIAKENNFSAFACHKGIAEKYNVRVPLILKLNGKTNLVKDDPYSGLICDVDEARRLGAVAVGYTIYIGSKYESKIFEDFGEVVREAHGRKMPVVAWIYPRGKAIKNEKKYMTYAARVGLELGADMIKIKYNGNKKDLAKAVDNAGRARVVVAGGVKKNEKLLLKQVKDIMDAGCAGLAIGRNIWQSKHPDKITEKIRKIVFK